MAMLAPVAWGEAKQLRPGWNLFSARQDVQIGLEASNQVQRRLPVVQNRELDGYLNAILRKLSQSQYARSLNKDGTRSELFPFTIRAVYDRNLNAFSLPGGPLFVNTGVLLAAENEAQLAGVIAHEMSHVVLRHATNQASKRNVVALPAILAGSLAGNSMLGQLAQLGIGFGANSVLLKFSRTDEAEADYNGAQIVADAGYNPVELGRFFEILEKKSNQQGGLAQFLSDHPNPGNRVAAINDELRQLPRRSYVDEQTGQFARMQELVRRLPAPAQVRETQRTASAEGSLPTPVNARPSSRLTPYDAGTYSFGYPENWQLFNGQQGNAVTVAPREGVAPGGNGEMMLGYGLTVNVASSQGNAVDLNRDTQLLIARLKQSNAEMRIGQDSRSVLVGGQPALLTTLYSASPFRGEQEVDALVTVARPDGLFYLMLIAPRSEFVQIQDTFELIVRSVRFN